LAEGLSTRFHSREGYALPDSQAGHFRNFELRTFPASNDKQGNSSDQRQRAEYWRNRNVFMVFPGGVDGPEIKNFFLMGISESLIGEGQPAQNNQENSNPDDRFHILRFRN
jgi:hypothetical protein